MGHISEATMNGPPAHYYQPVSTQGSQQPQQAVRHQKFHLQTEINEAEEEYPDDEVADEIPDQDSTEEEQDRLEIDDEGHVDESKDATSSVREKLRPVDMLPTHGGAF